MTNAALEYLGHRPVITEHRRDVGLYPFGLMYRPPTNGVPGIENQVFEQDALRTAVAFAEGVQHVDVAKTFRSSAD